MSRTGIVSHNSMSRSRKNGVAKHVGAGATDAVRKALDHGPKTLDGIVQFTGRATHIVRSAVNDLIHHGGAVRIVESNRRVKYYSFKDAPKPEPKQISGEFAFASKITIGKHFRWFV